MERFDGAILYHSYYDLDGLSELRQKLALLPGRLLLAVSLSERLAAQQPVEPLENERFLVSTNQGKDIGGKLLLINLMLRLYPGIPFWIFLHDKKSMQKHSGDFEKKELHRIIEPGQFRKLTEAFRHSRTGIVCQKSVIRNEYEASSDSFRTTNGELLKQLACRYGISTTDHRFAAGTMFAVRASIYEEFFSTHDPVSIRGSLEYGNVLDHEQGTHTHSWERLLCWIASARGYKLEGI